MLTCKKCGKRNVIAVQCKIWAPISAIVDGSPRTSVPHLLEVVNDVGVDVIGDRLLCVHCMEFVESYASCHRCGKEMKFETFSELRKTAAKMEIGAFFAPMCDDCLYSS